jgi:hypothetical protein
MKKWIYLSSLLLISNYSFASESSESNSGPVIDEYFTSTVAQKYQRQARNYSGHRVGVGIVDAQYVSESVIKFEYGYEFNGIAGFNLSGSSHGENIGNTELKYEGIYTQISTDLGYTFDLRGFNLKPYVLLGLMNISESVTIDNDSSIAFQGGIGVRATLDFGIYADLSIKNTNLDDFSVFTDRDGTESALTIGYKF